MSLDEFIASGESERDDIVPGILPTGGFLVLAGRERSFKTFLAIQLMFSVTTGEPFLGSRPTRQGSALYVSEEGVRSKVAKRFATIRKAYPTVEANDLRILFRQQVSLDEGQSWQYVTSEVDRMTAPALVVLDNLSVLMTGDEDKKSDMMAAIRPAQDLISQYGVTVLLVHHVAKSANGRLNKQMRGSSALPAAADGSLGLTRIGESDLVDLKIEPKDDEGQTLNLRWDADTFLLSVMGHGDVTVADVVHAVENLGAEGQPVTRAQVEAHVGRGKSRVGHLLMQAVADGVIGRTGSARATAYLANRGDTAWTESPSTGRT